MSSKDRPASVIQKKSTFDFTRKSSSNESTNFFDGRYTPIGKLEILCDDKKDKRKTMKKLKAIAEANIKGRVSAISSNNRRGKKSAGRIERSKQILSRSCERKHSKKKSRPKAVNQIKCPNTSELILNWPFKTNHTSKHEYIKRGFTDSKLDFSKERQSSLESKGKTNKIYKPTQNLTSKYNKLLSKAYHFPYDLNKTVTQDMVSKKIHANSKPTKSKSRNI